MSENVICMDGGHPPGVRRVNEVTVAQLRKALEAAESGELIGFVGTMVYFDETVSSHRVGACVSYRTVGSLEALKLSILKEMGF